VSEIMLQQTQVATVIPYFERFLALFPTIAKLAAAEEQEVLRAWEGLGYYRRARGLHQAAKILASSHDGQFPDSPEVVKDLPGIGRYTLGAILSQAYDRRLPILEANSLRVLCRLFACREPPDRGAVRKRLWQAAEMLLPVQRAGEFNQALMELGALVCTPSSPSCASCPLARLCTARRLSLHQRLPVASPRRQTIAVEEALVVVWRGSSLLVVQRPLEGRWPGMWEFPHAAVGGEESHQTAVKRLLRQLGLKARLGEEIQRIRHTVTHHRITLVCFNATYKSGKLDSDSYQQGRWLKIEDLKDYPFSSPQRRLAERLTVQQA
jgi:A/G-specific adenine glycosylase